VKEMRCNRCNEDMTAFHGSWFTSEVICSICEQVEKLHPLFELAQEIENIALLLKDYNFPGIGKPEDFDDWAKEKRKELVESKQSEL